MQKKSFIATSSCHTSLYNGKCQTSFVYKPHCSGVDATYIKLQADKSAPVILTVTGHSDGFKDNCSKYQLDNITLSATVSFKIFADPFNSKGHTPAAITLYGAGTGRDEKYPCQMK